MQKLRPMRDRNNLCLSVPRPISLAIPHNDTQGWGHTGYRSRFDLGRNSVVLVLMEQMVLQNDHSQGHNTLQFMRHLPIQSHITSLWSSQGKVEKLRLRVGN